MPTCGGFLVGWTDTDGKERTRTFAPETPQNMVAAETFRTQLAREHRAAIQRGDDKIPGAPWLQGIPIPQQAPQPQHKPQPERQRQQRWERD